MDANYTVKLTYEELTILKSLCSRNSRTEAALNMAVLAAPVPKSVETWRSACAVADGYSATHLKEPADKLERWVRWVDNLRRDWDQANYLYNLLLSGAAYPFRAAFDDVDIKRWYQLAYDRARVLIFIKQLDATERKNIEDLLHNIPDESDLRKAISFACERLEAQHCVDVPRLWREIEFKTTDTEDWL